MSVLRSIGYTKQISNFQSKVTVSDLLQLIIQFLLVVKACIEFEEILVDLVSIEIRQE